MNSHPSHHGPPPEALAPWSSPSSLSPTLRHQHRWWAQQATSLPSWEHWGAVGGRRRAHLLGGSPGLGQAAAWGQVKAVHCNARHHGPSPASVPLDTKGTFPCAKETPNPFLPHPVLPGTLSPIPQPGLASMSGTCPVLPLKPPSNPLCWHQCPPGDTPTDSYGTSWMRGVPSSSWCATLPYGTSVYLGRAAGGSSGRQTPQS